MRLRAHQSGVFRLERTRAAFLDAPIETVPFYASLEVLGRIEIVIQPRINSPNRRRRMSRLQPYRGGPPQNAKLAPLG
jgi:hypothetical protein